MIPTISSYNPDLLLEAIQTFPDKVPVNVVDLYFSAKGIKQPYFTRGGDFYVNERDYVEDCLAQQVTPFAVKKVAFRDGSFIEVPKDISSHFSMDTLGPESLDAKARGEDEGHPPSVVHVECWERLAEAKKYVIPQLVGDQYQLADGYVGVGAGHIKLASRMAAAGIIRIVQFDAGGSYSEQAEILAAGSSDRPMWNWYFALKKRHGCAPCPPREIDPFFACGQSTPSA
jgi:hypothetical protein